MQLPSAGVPPHGGNGPVPVAAAHPLAGPHPRQRGAARAAREPAWRDPAGPVHEEGRPAVHRRKPQVGTQSGEATFQTEVRFRQERFGRALDRR